MAGQKPTYEFTSRKGTSPTRHPHTRFNSAMQRREAAALDRVKTIDSRLLYFWVEKGFQNETTPTEMDVVINEQTVKGIQFSSKMRELTIPRASPYHMPSKTIVRQNIPIRPTAIPNPRFLSTCFLAQNIPTQRSAYVTMNTTAGVDAVRQDTRNPACKMTMPAMPEATMDGDTLAIHQERRIWSIVGIIFRISLETIANLSSAFWFGPLESWITRQRPRPQTAEPY